jgi:hypothetical protein
MFMTVRGGVDREDFQILPHDALIRGESPLTLIDVVAQKHNKKHVQYSQLISSLPGTTRGAEREMYNWFP